MVTLLMMASDHSFIISPLHLQQQQQQQQQKHQLERGKDDSKQKFFVPKD